MWDQREKIKRQENIQFHFGNSHPDFNQSVPAFSIGNHFLAYILITLSATVTFSLFNYFNSYP